MQALLPSFLFLAACGAFAIFAGSMIATVGSRAIAKRIDVTVTTTQNEALPSVQVYAQLARSKNITLTRNDADALERWSIDAVFVEKILIGVTADDLQRMDTVTIRIGVKDFALSPSELVAVTDETSLPSILPHIPANDIATYKLFAAPQYVFLEHSRIPVKKEFFGSLINWGGDYVFFIEPIAKASGAVILYILTLFGIFSIYLFHRGKQVMRSDTSPVENSPLSDYLAVLITTLISLIVLALTVITIGFIYTPNTAVILRDAATVYLDFLLPAFLPKPVERLQFILGTGITALSIPFTYYWIRKKIDILTSSRLYALYRNLSLITAGILLIGTCAGLAMSNYLYVAKSIVFDTYGKFFYLLGIFPAVLYLFLQQPSILTRYRHELRITLQAIVMIAFGVIFITSVHTLGATFSEFHTNPLLYPITQVLSGKTLLVDLTSLYGLFPLFIAPIFAMLGGISLFSFSVIMGALTLVSFSLILQSMRQYIKIPWITYAGFMALLFYTYLTHSTETAGIYFQYWPVRILFPALFIYLTGTYLRTENKYAYYSSLLTIALAPLWNFDTGFFVLITWVCVLVYHDFSHSGTMQEKFIRSARHVGSAVLMLTGVLATFAAYTYVTSGSLPSISLFFMYQKLFLSGYFLIPLPPPLHFWGIIALLYLVGLIISIRALLTQKVVYSDKIILMLSLLGIGLLIYYEGRSHDYTLFGPSYPAFILLALYTERLYTHITASKTFLLGHALIFTLLLFVISAAPFSVLSNLPTYAADVKKVVSGYATKDTTSYATNITFIRHHTHEGEAVLILARHKDGLYHAETGTYAALTLPSSTDTFFIHEVETMIDFLSQNTNIKVFAEYPLTLNDLYDTRIATILAEHYTVSASSTAGLLLLERAK